MIFTERTIKIANDVCQIDNPIVLYRGDYNVEIRFTIIECPYKYSTKNSSNIIETVDASYGQLVIKVPNDGSPIFSDVVETKEGSVVFTLSGEMIDESIEVGDYTFQIRLFDTNKESRATIPPVENGISIREPIAFEDVTTTNEVGEATVGYALTTAATPEDAFDNEGNYNKTTWGTGDRITAAKLNKIEAGIDGVNQKIASGSTSGEGMTPEQANQLSTAYQHSQAIHAPNDAEANVQSDWNEADTTSDAYIKNKPTNLATIDDIPTVPTNVSELTNDSHYATETFVTNKIAEASLGGGSGEVDLSSYAKITDLPTKTSQLTNDSEYITETELEAKGYLTEHQDISGKVDKVDGKGLSTNDLTNILKTNYDTAYTHSQSTHAPSNAQRNSDITKEEIEAKLTGEITTHSHPNSSVVSSEFKKVVETYFGEECYSFTVTQDKDGNPIQLKEGIIRITAAQPLETSKNLTYAVGFADWLTSYNGKCAIYMLNVMKNYEFYASCIYFKVINQRVLAINLGQVRYDTNKPIIGYNENASAAKTCNMTSFRLIDKDYIDRITVAFDMANTGLFSKDSLLEVWGI